MTVLEKILGWPIVLKYTQNNSHLRRDIRDVVYVLQCKQNSAYTEKDPMFLCANTGNIRPRYFTEDKHFYINYNLTVYLDYLNCWTLQIHGKNPKEDSNQSSGTSLPLHR